MCIGLPQGLLQTSEPYLIHDNRFGLLITHFISLTVIISLYFAMEGKMAVVDATLPPSRGCLGRNSDVPR